MTEQYHVRIEKERLVFSAAHFITYDGDICEPLHGHNYHVAAEVRGPLDENYYVIDFIALRDALQAIVDRLDHRMLLPTRHPTITVKESRAAAAQSGAAALSGAELRRHEVEVTHGDRRWVFPSSDCVLLELENTTAELLARHIGQLLLAALEQRLGSRPTDLRVAVDECDGQWGVWELRASS